MTVVVALDVASAAVAVGAGVASPASVAAAFVAAMAAAAAAATAAATVGRGGPGHTQGYLCTWCGVMTQPSTTAIAATAATEAAAGVAAAIAVALALPPCPDLPRVAFFWGGGSCSTPPAASAAVAAKTHCLSYFIVFSARNIVEICSSILETRHLNSRSCECPDHLNTPETCKTQCFRAALTGRAFASLRHPSPSIAVHRHPSPALWPIRGLSP